METQGSLQPQRAEHDLGARKEQEGDKKDRSVPIADTHYYFSNLLYVSVVQVWSVHTSRCACLCAGEARGGYLLSWSVPLFLFL